MEIQILTLLLILKFMMITIGVWPWSSERQTDAQTKCRALKSKLKPHFAWWTIKIKTIFRTSRCTTSWSWNIFMSSLLLFDRGWLNWKRKFVMEEWVVRNISTSNSCRTNEVFTNNVFNNFVSWRFSVKGVCSRAYGGKWVVRNL